MTDYFDPASWDGIAEKDGYIILIDICKYDLGKSGKKVTKKVTLLIMLKLQNFKQQLTIVQQVKMKKKRPEKSSKR